MSSPPWCRRRPAVPEDDDGSLSRGPEEKPVQLLRHQLRRHRERRCRRGRTSAEDLGTTTGAATTGRHPDTGRRAHDDREVTTGAAVTPAPISRPA